MMKFNFPPRTTSFQILFKSYFWKKKLFSLLKKEFSFLHKHNKSPETPPEETSSSSPPPPLFLSPLLLSPPRFPLPPLSPRRRQKKDGNFIQGNFHHRCRGCCRQMVDVGEEEEENEGEEENEVEAEEEGQV